MGWAMAAAAILTDACVLHVGSPRRCMVGADCGCGSHNRRLLFVLTASANSAAVDYQAQLYKGLCCRLTLRGVCIGILHVCYCCIWGHLVHALCACQGV